MKRNKRRPARSPISPATGKRKWPRVLRIVVPGLPDRILAEILRVQSGPEARGQIDASEFVTEERHGKDGTRLALWRLAQSVVLPGSVDFYLVELKDSGSSFVLVPWQKIPEVAGGLFVGFLGKTAGMVDAAEGADRDALLARARVAGVDKAIPGLSSAPPRRR